ncbi:hypothetical protein M0Q97_12015 [Candidatus Dojkabacteria bacterium]|jgi:hypothetical protein|nr:hypothetical protein [Candidatus Dojkabacteria bacterium]
MKILQTFEQHLNDKKNKNDKYITTSYRKIIPDENYIGFEEENGWEDEEGESMLPDEYDIEEGITTIDNAYKFLKKNYAIEASSSHFNKGIWYSTDEEDEFVSSEETRYSFHLNGFTEQEEEAIFNMFKDETNLLYKDYLIWKKAQKYNI